MKDLAGVITMLIPIACGCVLPIMVVWFIIRMKKFSPKPRLLKEKLLTKLLWGSLTAMIGLGFVGFGAWLGYVGGGGSDDPMASVCIGLILLAVGIAFLVNFSVGKKMLSKEIEAEEKQVTTLPE